MRLLISLMAGTCSGRYCELDHPVLPLQFLRQGYFCRDRVDGKGDRLVFNRTVTLRDTWARIEKVYSEARKAGETPAGRALCCGPGAPEKRRAGTFGSPSGPPG